MKIKKFISSNLSQGKTSIMRELGEDAVILSSRDIIDPESGAKKVEIVAAIDDQLPQVSKRFQSKKKTLNTSNSSNNEANITYDELKEEIEIIHQKLNKISDEVKYKFASALSDSHSMIYKILINAGLSESYALEILAKVSEIGFTGSAKDMFFKARQILTQNIMISEPLKNSNQRRVYLFIGPTGSGKTTSLVKLAVVCQLVLKSNILIVSADNSKVGGADQLQTYSSVLGIPFKAISNSAELATLMDNELQRDIIFIDTAGKNPFNKENLEDIKLLQDVIDNIHKFLVISANLSLDTMDEVIDRYKFLEPNDMILTKIDETKSLGSVLSVLKKFKLPLAYLTNGQNVPEDIEPAEREQLSKFILPDKLLKEL
jgi:flagellar biosynthesis protein FlhF